MEPLILIALAALVVWMFRAQLFMVFASQMVRSWPDALA